MGYLNIWGTYVKKIRPFLSVCWLILPVIIGAVGMLLGTSWLTISLWDISAGVIGITGALIVFDKNGRNSPS